MASSKIGSIVFLAAHERSDDGFVHSMIKPGGRRTCASDRFPGSRYLARVSDSGKEILPPVSLRNFPERFSMWITPRSHVVSYNSGVRSMPKSSSDYIFVRLDQQS